MPILLLDDLLSLANNTFSRLKVFPKHDIASELNTEVGKWKTQIADACLALVLEPSKHLQSHSFDTPDNDYCIDLRATSGFLPRRLKGQLKQIDANTRRIQTSHEAKIAQGNIICYRATEDGKLVAFEPRSTSIVHKALGVLSIAHQLYYFNFPELKQPVISKYNIEYCAHPTCGMQIQRQENHLQLCEQHDEELMWNIEHRWLPAAAKDIYNVIKKKVGESDSKEIHHRIYYQLLSQLNVWITQIDHIIPTDCTGTGVQTSSVDAWLVLQLRPMRQLLMLMKSAIFLYRMYLNPGPVAGIIGAIVALFVNALHSDEVGQTVGNGFVQMIRSVCGTFAAMFAYVGIGILFTLDLIFTDDAYIAIILKVVGGALAITGVIVAAIVATPVAIIGGIWLGATGLASFLIGKRMERDRDRRGKPHTHLIQVHLDLRLARERLWQWTE
jgi:hypothetical protein